MLKTLCQTRPGENLNKRTRDELMENKPNLKIKEEVCSSRLDLLRKHVVHRMLFICQIKGIPEEKEIYLAGVGKVCARNMHDLMENLKN